MKKKGSISQYSVVMTSFVCVLSFYVVRWSSHLSNRTRSIRTTLNIFPGVHSPRIRNKYNIPSTVRLPISFKSNKFGWSSNEKTSTHPPGPGPTFCAQKVERCYAYHIQINDIWMGMASSTVQIGAEVQLTEMKRHEVLQVQISFWDQIGISCQALLIAHANRCVGSTSCSSFVCHLLLVFHFPPKGHGTLINALLYNWIWSLYRNPYIIQVTSLNSQSMAVLHRFRVAGRPAGNLSSH